ncbi:MAG TPA: flavodoxin family protein [Candidatus Acidoferrum sp.]|nr:flavodoxin family protein [Candidatus Acidoferrum sp.]
MIEVLAISGSPVKGSSTDILLETVGKSLLESAGPDRCRLTVIRLNELRFIACQSCGKAPDSRWCLYDDDLTPVYEKVAECDCLLFGSPIYFDSVSAQAKAFMDRCNCFRPLDFGHTNPGHRFVKRLTRKRPGGMVLVSGEGQWIEGARRTIAGFFKWIEVTNEGLLSYAAKDDYTIGAVRNDFQVLGQAKEMGTRLAEIVVRDHES